MVLRMRRPFSVFNGGAGLVRDREGDHEGRPYRCPMSREPSVTRQETT